MERNKRINICIRLSEHLKEELDTLAEGCNATISEVAREILEAALENIRKDTD